MYHLERWLKLGQNRSVLIKKNKIIGMIAKGKSECVFYNGNGIVLRTWRNGIALGHFPKIEGHLSPSPGGRGSFSP